MKDMGDHFEYISVWVNDMLIASKNSKAIKDKLSKEYTLKGVGHLITIFELTLRGLWSQRGFSPWDLAPILTSA